MITWLKEHKVATGSGIALGLLIWWLLHGRKYLGDPVLVTVPMPPIGEIPITPPPVLVPEPAPVPIPAPVLVPEPAPGPVPAPVPIPAPAPPENVWWPSWEPIEQPSPYQQPEFNPFPIPPYREPEPIQWPEKERIPYGDIPSGYAEPIPVPSYQMYRWRDGVYRETPPPAGYEWIPPIGVITPIPLPGVPLPELPVIPEPVYIPVW